MKFSCDSNKIYVVIKGSYGFFNYYCERSFICF